MKDSDHSTGAIIGPKRTVEVISCCTAASLNRSLGLRAARSPALHLQLGRSGHLSGACDLSGSMTAGLSHKGYKGGQVSKSCDIASPRSKSLNLALNPERCGKQHISPTSTATVAAANHPLEDSVADHRVRSNDPARPDHSSGQDRGPGTDPDPDRHRIGIFENLVPPLCVQGLTRRVDPHDRSDGAIPADGHAMELK